MNGMQYSKIMKPKPKNRKLVKANKTAHKQASERFRKITERAKKIREKHPKMKWKNAIRKASKELY